MFFLESFLQLRVFHNVDVNAHDLEIVFQCMKREKKSRRHVIMIWSSNWNMADVNPVSWRMHFEYILGVIIVNDPIPRCRWNGKVLSVSVWGLFLICN